MKTISILVNKTASFLLKLIHRGGSMPGTLALKCDKDILKKLTIKGKVIVVTGTNGKTSTSNMICETLLHANQKVISNRKGDNLKDGITTQLLNNCSLNGVLECDYCVFECDELNVPYIVKHIPVDALVITNFFRDQLDRAQEMEQLIGKLESALEDFKGTLVLNANDPNVTRFAKKCPNANAVYFAMNQCESSSKDGNEASEGKFCPFCNSKINYTYYQYSHIGEFACPNCDFKTPTNKHSGTLISLKDNTFSYDGITFKASQDGLYTMYNCMAVLSVAKLFDIDIEHAKAVFAQMEIPAGRNETFVYQGHNLIMNLIKNPTGANEVMKVVETDDSLKTILFVINDNWGDGIDISWLYDTAFEKIIRDDTIQIICSGTRAYDMALRLKYGGWSQAISIYENLDDACDALLKAETTRYAIVTYSALANTRKLLRRKMK